MNETNARLEGLLIKASRWMWVVIAFLLIGGVAEYVTLSRQQDREKLAVYQACLRTQDLRDLAVNLNGIRQHDEDLLISSILVQRSLLRSLSHHDRAQRLRGQIALVHFAGDLVRAPVVDCKKAVYSPPYIAPKPVPLGPRPVLRFP